MHCHRQIVLLEKVHEPSLQVLKMFSHCQRVGENFTTKTVERLSVPDKWPLHPSSGSLRRTMSHRASSVVTTPWIRKHLSTMDHNFYSPIPKNFFHDTQIVSYLNRHFADNDMKYFKTCFQVLSGTSNTIPVQDSQEIHRSLVVMHDLIHGRYVVSGAGLESVHQKYRQRFYGNCPRWLCDEHALLPIGLHDTHGISTAQCFCPKCRDVYCTPNHNSVDSIAFGTSLPHLILDKYPDLCPFKPDTEYVPKIFGFKIHPSSPVLCKYNSKSVEKPS